MSERAAVILAAGQGTRMRSPLPKVLHPLAGRTLLDRAIDAAEGLGCSRIVVVAGRHAPEVEAHVIRRLGSGSVAIQDPPLGTGHAVLAAEAALEGFEGRIVVTYADTPLLDAPTVEPLFTSGPEGALCVLGFEAEDPGPYGRLILDGTGRLQRIVEAKDASSCELEVTLCNSGVLAAPASLLFSLLKRVTCENAKGEYYLTDVVALARSAGHQLEISTAPEETLMGVNSQAELARAEGAFQDGRRRALLEAGVTMPAPSTVFLAWDTLIEPGARIEPNVVFGPGAIVRRGAVIRSFCHIEGSVVAGGATVGPFARLRPGAEIGPGAHIGNFVEVKNVQVEAGAKANHLAYLGDGVVGAGANIGAGVIFCNYDGFSKHRTEIGPGAFIGSNSALVAPVSVGAGAYVGSGSVITRGVAEDALALARSPQVEKAGWADRFRTARTKPA